MLAPQSAAEGILKDNEEVSRYVDWWLLQCQAYHVKGRLSNHDTTITVLTQ